MINKSEIFKWIDSTQDYYDGVALFEKYSTLVALKRNFRAKGYTKKTFSFLQYQLGKLAGISHEEVKIRRREKIIKLTPAKKIPKIKKTKPQDKISPDIKQHLDQEIQNIIELKNRLYKESASLQQQLPHIKSDKERNKVAQEILRLSDQIEKLWYKIDYHRKHGMLPVDQPKEKQPPVKDLDPAELVKRRNNLRSNISRQKRYIAQSSKPETIEKHRERLLFYEKQLQDVEKSLEQR